MLQVEDAGGWWQPEETAKGFPSEEDQERDDISISSGTKESITYQESEAIVYP